MSDKDKEFLLVSEHAADLVDTNSLLPEKKKYSVDLQTNYIIEFFEEPTKSKQRIICEFVGTEQTYGSMASQTHAYATSLSFISSDTVEMDETSFKSRFCNIVKLTNLKNNSYQHFHLKGYEIEKISALHDRYVTNTANMYRSKPNVYKIKLHLS